MHKTGIEAIDRWWRRHSCSFHVQRCEEFTNMLYTPTWPSFWSFSCSYPPTWVTLPT